MASSLAAQYRFWRDFYRQDLQNWLFLGKTALAALLALWLAYRFQLDSPSTVVITVFIVMQSRNGMVLAKSFYRAIGTIIGSIVALLLVALFPDAGIGFLAGMALWIGFCTAGARYFRNFQAYAFVLAGYTAALVGIPAALDPGHAVEIGIARLSDVMLGILVASSVSAVVFPQSLGELLQSTAQSRLEHFLGNSLRVLNGGVPRADWIVLHLAAIQETLQLDNYRSGSFFESAAGRRHNERVGEMIADMMFASGTLHLLNSHIRRLRRPALTPVQEASQELLEQLRSKLEELRQTIQAGNSAQARIHLQSVQDKVIEQLTALRERLHPRLDAAQALALDSLILLLTRYLAEFRRYLDSYHRLLHPQEQMAPLPLPMTIDEVRDRRWRASFSRPPTEIIQPLSGALRSILVVAIVSCFWLWTAWPSGPSALIIAVVLVALFSTFPNPVASARQMGFGIVLAFLAALLFSLEFLPRLQGFLMLALALFPFFLLSPWLLTYGRWAGTAAGFGIFFPQLAVPDNPHSFSYLNMLNSGFAELIAVFLVGIAFFLIFPPGNHWERRRLLERFRALVRAVAKAPLGNLRNRYAAESREYLRLLAAALTPQEQGDAQVLREAMRLDELAEGILQLRILLHARNEDTEGNPLQIYARDYVELLLQSIQERRSGAMSGEDRRRLRATLDAVQHLPEERLDPALHPILPPDALFRVYVHVIASVSRRLSQALELQDAG
ncbi:FUSC family protein [Acidithiobacillus sp. AMEEHan]|uniref:FUSC family protein n=1 Tax=Acidithiobacillus sp. AMEEHan TaxID=2994951 RepID=UPI0027E57937|nr:FUSC family protein [Acidithiobacillus sp. AMEEHan]